MQCLPSIRASVFSAAALSSPIKHPTPAIKLLVLMLCAIPVCAGYILIVLGSMVEAGNSSRQLDLHIQMSWVPHFGAQRAVVVRYERSTVRTARWQRERASHTRMAVATESSDSVEGPQVEYAEAPRWRLRETLRASSGHLPMMRSGVDTCWSARGGPSMHNSRYLDATADLKAQTGIGFECYRYCHTKSIGQVLATPSRPLG